MGSVYEWLIATRYLRSTHRRGFVSFVALISILGLTLGVGVLIVVLSVMNGFERELRSRILSVTSHATLMGLDGTLEDWRTARAAAVRQPGVLAAAPYVEEQAMLAHDAHVVGTLVRGVLPEEERHTTGLAQRITSGSIEDLAPGTYRIILGSALALGGGYYVSDWTRKNTNFFRSIEITKSMMFVILLMIVAVAAFNIIATLVMIVKEKQTDIAILRTLGAGPRNVLATFAIQGVLIGLAGTALGAGLGVLVAHNVQWLVHALEHALGTHFLDPRVYNMSDLPAYVERIDVLKVCGVAFALCSLATLYPAWRAARMAPAEALRHD